MGGPRPGIQEGAKPCPGTPTHHLLSPAGEDPGPPAPWVSPEPSHSGYFFVGATFCLASWLRKSWLKAWSGEERFGNVDYLLRKMNLLRTMGLRQTGRFSDPGPTIKSRPRGRPWVGRRWALARLSQQDRALAPGSRQARGSRRQAGHTVPPLRTRGPGWLPTARSEPRPGGCRHRVPEGPSCRSLNLLCPIHQGPGTTRPRGDLSKQRSPGHLPACQDCGRAAR